MEGIGVEVYNVATSDALSFSAGDVVEISGG